MRKNEIISYHVECGMKNLKFIVGILFIFIIGAAGGGMAIIVFHNPFMKIFQRDDCKVREKILLNRLSGKLDLDDRQRGQVRAIIEKTHAKIDGIRNQFRPRVEGVLKDSREAMRRILRPEQRNKFDRLMAKHEAGHR